MMPHIFIRLTHRWLYNSSTITLEGMFQDIRAKFSLHDGSTIDPRGESHCDSITTGLAYFAECQRHSAKAGKHSAKKSPSVALGEAHTAFLLPAHADKGHALQ